MNLKEKRWVIWACVVTFLDIFLPFGLLRENGTLTGAFLAWTLLTLAVAFSGVVYTSDWGKKDQVS